MQRVLIVTDVPFWLKLKGSQQRIAAIVDYLKKYFEVTVMFLGGESTPALDAVSFVHVSRHRGLAAFAWKIFSILPARVQQAVIGLLNRLRFQRPLASFRDNRVYEAFTEVVSSGGFNAVIVEYIWHGYLADAVDDTDTLVLLDTHDIRHRRVDDYARFGRTPDKTVTKEQELEVFSKFEGLIAIQPVEHAYIEALYPGRAILAMHPAEAYPGRYRDRLRARHDDDKLRLIYIGAYSDVNLDAIQWFVRDVWNEELARYFDLHVYGTICDSLQVNQAGVSVFGRIASIDGVYRDADVAINPQRFGSGLKIKNVEAMGYGIPVVTTSVGAEGLDKLAGRALLCADDPEAMRRELLRLRDAALRETLSDNALEYVALSLTPEACFGALRDLIRNHTGEQS